MTCGLRRLGRPGRTLATPPGLGCSVVVCVHVALASIGEGGGLLRGGLADSCLRVCWRVCVCLGRLAMFSCVQYRLVVCRMWDVEVLGVLLVEV